MILTDPTKVITDIITITEIFNRKKEFLFNAKSED